MPRCLSDSNSVSASVSLFLTHEREGERVIRAKNAHLQVMQGGDGGIRRNIDSCDASLGVINLSGEKEVS